MPNPAVPAPRSWLQGMQVKAPYLAADVSDAVAFLTARPVFAGAQEQSTQTIPDTGTSCTGIQLDTEDLDDWSMHQNASAHPELCYPPVPGWYLAQAQATLTSVTGGIMSASIRAAQNGGSQQDHGGQSVLADSVSFAPSAVAAKLVRMVSTGSFGSGDYCGPSMLQATGAGAQPTFISTAKFPRFSLRWVAALSGTVPLPVPPGDIMPIPPAFLTHGYMNANIRDAIRFLKFPPILEWTYNAGTDTIASSASLPAATFNVQLDTKVVDNYSALNGSNVFRAPVPGRYFIYAALSLQSLGGAIQALAAGINVTSGNYNGGTPIAMWPGAIQAQGGGIATDNVAVFRRTLRLDTGDRVSLAGWQNSSGGAAATILGSSGGSFVFPTRLIIVWTGL